MNTIKIVFAGTPEFAVPSLEALLEAGYDVCKVYTQPDRPAGRGLRLHESPVKQTALRHHIAIAQPSTFRDATAQAELKALNADLMIVVAYGLILPTEVLQMFRYGCINVHASLLPRWRGAAPIQRAILEGDEVTGITTMQMDKGLDTGDMLMQSVCSIETTDTSGTLHDKLAILGAETLLATLDALKIEQLHPQAQDETKATHAAKIQKQDAKINWKLPAMDIERSIRAFNPWPIAFCHIHESTLRIWQAECVQLNANQYLTSSPGMILKITREGIDVATLDGVLRLKKIQLPGGKPLMVNDILNSHPTWLTEAQCFQ